MTDLVHSTSDNNNLMIIIAKSLTLHNCMTYQQKLGTWAFWSLKPKKKMLLGIQRCGLYLSNLILYAKVTKWCSRKQLKMILYPLLWIFLIKWPKWFWLAFWYNCIRRIGLSSNRSKTQNKLLLKLRRRRKAFKRSNQNVVNCFSYTEYSLTMNSSET